MVMFHDVLLTNEMGYNQRITIQKFRLILLVLELETKTSMCQLILNQESSELGTDFFLEINNVQHLNKVEE